MYSNTHRWIKPYSSEVISIFGTMSSEDWGEGSPLDPPVHSHTTEVTIVLQLHTEQLCMKATKPCIQFWWGRFNMSAKIMTPVTESNIGCTDGEVDLELQRIPTLHTQRRNRK